MKALAIVGPGQAELIDLPQPSPMDGEVEIALAYVGYCGSDLTSFRGLNPLVTYPRVPGHEVAGTITGLGPHVAGLAVGQTVTVLPYFNCGTCRACNAGKPNACLHNQTMGVQREGAMTARIVVPQEKVIPVSGLSLRDMALIEPCSVGFHAVNRAQLMPAETVVVLGCGMIGLGALMGSLRAGAKVIVVDLSRRKLDIALKLGAAHAICPEDGDVAAQIAALLPEGPDVVIEAVGAAVTFLQAVDIVGQCGRVVYIGYAKDPVSYDTKRFLTKELDIRGARNAVHSDFDNVIEWLKGHPEAGDLIVTATAKLDEAPRALAHWDQNPGSYTKILVQIESTHEA
ncbi:MAG: sorbitol dehydrogenase [Pelagibacterium sp. SCN 63-23]|nr:MAG: sorbitol dehydrogenase [Pelagibacterium sp. SCN 63-23]